MAAARTRVAATDALPRETQILQPEAAARGGLAGSPYALRSPRSARLGAEGTVRVRVAARVRPLLPLEAAGHSKAKECIEVSNPALAIGKNCFIFDHAFSPDAAQEEVYQECVEPLVDATLGGINGTLLAYGQTGSGKTYTMGTSGVPSVPEGALQRALRAIFNRTNEQEGPANFRVSYVEIFTDTGKAGSSCAEEIRDLLNPGQAHPLATIKTDVDGQVRLEGVAEHEVWTVQEALSLLTLGSTARATCSTRMNVSSSRSHAIFSLEVVQRRLVAGVPASLTAKFQFVDLAGSEKVKLSGVEGEQLSQAININHGLFVLGRVITALTEGHLHVPFRESKLTRILQNSLGGNSRTCMIACVSPSDAHIADSISTLTYAARAKEITNKPVVNQGPSCPNCSALQAQLEALRGERKAAQATARQPLLRECVAELERACEGLHPDREWLLQEPGQCRGGPDLLPGQEAPEVLHGPTQADGAAEAEARARRAEALYVRCSERLAALQQAVRAAEVAVDEPLLCPAEAGVDEEELDELDQWSEAGGFSAGGASEVLNAEGSDLAWLEQEATRKQRLLLQLEQNQQSMAALEAQSEERIRQHEAHRDIAERELARLHAELEAARSREEQLTSLQERYDQRLAALRERNTALVKERREVQRLRAMQRKQETRLRVLQDSIRQVKGERDDLKSQLAAELQRRKEQEAKGKRERSAAQEKIKNLSARVASLKRYEASVAGDTGTTRDLLHRKCPLSTRSHACKVPGSKCQADGSPWEKLLQSVAERAQRERQLIYAQNKLRELELQALATAAQRERLSVEAELGEQAVGSSLATLEADTTALTAALEYQHEQVWMLQRELDACPGLDPEEAAARLAEGMDAGERAAALVWLCSETARLREAVCLAREAQEAQEAEMAACRAEVLENRQRTSKQESTLDLVRSEYESRVASLLQCLGEGLGDTRSLQQAIGEEPAALLARRVAELEGTLSQERSAAKDRGQQRLEHDMELITSYRDKDSENALLRAQLSEATSKAERAVARGARREARLQQRLCELEARPSATDAAAGPRQPACAEASWGLELLEDFWRSTGLGENREELLASLRADVEALCQQKLQHHLQWKQELEERIGGLRGQLGHLAELLGEEGEQPPADANLLQTARALELSVTSQTALREARARELLDLARRIEAVHQRLHGTAPGEPVASPEAPGALHPRALEAARGRLKALEALERERQATVVERLEGLKGLWADLGLRVPEELEGQELAFVRGEVPVSDACLSYLDARQAGLTCLRSNLESKKAGLQEEVSAWKQRLAPFQLPLPEVPHGLPLTRCVEAFEALEADLERTAADFVCTERVALDEFGMSSLLPNVRELLDVLEPAEELTVELEVMAEFWQRLRMQRSEHRRISDLIAARETLEAEMRQFDVDASDPSRFKKRGYSGVQENKRRADYQRQLRMLDSSLSASMTDWAQREGIPFCLGGVEYRGSEILPTEHTHMYAWTSKQLAQKRAAKTGVALQPSPRLQQRGPGQPPTGRCRAQSDSSSMEHSWRGASPHAPQPSPSGALRHRMPKGPLGDPTALRRGSL